MENDYLGILRVPLGPWDPKTLLAIGVEVASEMDEIVPEFPDAKGVEDVGNVGLTVNGDVVIIMGRKQGITLPIR